MGEHDDGWAVPSIVDYPDLHERGKGEAIGPDIDVLRQMIEDELLRGFPISEPRRELPSLETLVEYAVSAMEKQRDHLITANATNKRRGARIADLEKAEGEEDQLIEKLSDILTRTADALKGEPDPLLLHSWHDLPEVATSLRDQVKELEGPLNNLLAIIFEDAGEKATIFTSPSEAVDAAIQVFVDYKTQVEDPNILPYLRTRAEYWRTKANKKDELEQKDNIYHTEGRYD